MVEAIRHKNLTVLIDKWADESLRNAEKFVEAHSEVFPRGVGLNQMYGMRASVVNNINALREFLKNRAQRAKRNGVYTVDRFYTDFLQEVDHIEEQARSLAGKLNVRDHESAIQDLGKEMAKKYIQHIIAQSQL